MLWITERTATSLDFPLGVWKDRAKSWEIIWREVVGVNFYGTEIVKGHRSGEDASNEGGLVSASK